MNQIVELTVAETAEVEGGLIFLWGVYACGSFAAGFAAGALATW